MLDKFIAYLYDMLGNIYVWGAQGQTAITETWIKSRETSTKNANRAIAFWKKRLAAGATNLRTFDCSGLGMYFLQNLEKLYKNDMSANSMYGQCEKLARKDVKRGDWVFRGTSLKKTHIGYVVDDLNVVEAKGRDDGVVKRHIDASSGYWKYYGRPKIFKAEIERGDVVILKGNEGAVVTEWQTCLKTLGYDLGTYGVNKDGVDGKFGAKTEAATKGFQRSVKLSETGVVNDATWAAMCKTMRTSQSADLKAENSVLKSKINAARAALG